MRHDIVFNRRGCCKFPYVHAPWLYEFLIDFAVTENSVRVAGKVLGLSILIKESLFKERTGYPFCTGQGEACGAKDSKLNA